MSAEASELHARFSQMMSEIDQEVGADRYDRVQSAERLTRKLKLIMSDHDIDMAVGAWVRYVVLRGGIGQYRMTEEQAERVEKVVGVVSPMRGRVSSVKLGGLMLY